MSRIEFFSSRFHYSFGCHPPTLSIASGASLRVICADSDNMLADGSILPTGSRQLGLDATAFQGNPCAGPICVKDAEPGDCIEVKIEAIVLDRDFGQTGLAPAHGLLSSNLLLNRSEVDAEAGVPRHLYRWQIDRTAEHATLANPLGDSLLSVPLDPFVGCIGVCPRDNQPISTLDSGDHGGNMDLPLTRAGSTIILPVHHPGALLMLGDLHAAQGHGEIIGGAIETSGTVDCTITLKKNQAIPAPRFHDGHFLAAAGADGDVRGAIARAYANLLDWVVAAYELNRWDAYNLISQTGSIIVGNLNAPPYPVAARIPVSVLPAAVSLSSGRRK